MPKWWENWRVIERFANGLSFRENPGSDRRTREQRHALVEDVPLSRVLDELLVPMQFSNRDSADFSGLQLAIQWHLMQNPDATAGIYRMADYRPRLPGGGIRRRQIDDHGRIRELFQGEAPVEPKRLRGSVYPGDRQIHSAATVTVQLHDLDLTGPRGNLLQGHVPAIAVWLPDSMRRDFFGEISA